MVIAILSYCKLEIIPLQRVDSAAKYNGSRKMVFILVSAEDIDTAINSQIACKLFYRYSACN